MTAVFSALTSLLSQVINPMAGMPAGYEGMSAETSQLYLQSLFAVPLGIVTSFLSLSSGLPTVGECVFGVASFVIGVYGVVLNVRAIKVAHEMDTGPAVAAVLLLPVVLLVGVACLVIMMLILLGPAISDTSEEIILNI